MRLFETRIEYKYVAQMGLSGDLTGGGPGKMGITRGWIPRWVVGRGWF